jgi:putative endonuclease
MSEIGADRPSPRVVLARHGEELAAAHLRARGIVLLARNWRPSRAAHAGELRGELDLVGRAGDTLIVCEVKARRGDAEAALAAVTPGKQQRLRRLAARFVEESGLRPRGIRFDVVGVCVRPDGGTELVHLEEAF